MDAYKRDLAEQFHDSLDRCGEASKFLGRFYQLFTQSSAEIAAKFAHTDLRAQTRALKTSFYMAMLAADGSNDASQYLQRIAALHDHQHLDIKPAYYHYWIESLIQSVREHDPRFDAAVEQTWRDFMAPAIRYMTSQYERKKESPYEFS